MLSSGLKLLCKNLMVHKEQFLRENANCMHLGYAGLPCKFCCMEPRAPLTSWGAAFSRVGEEFMEAAAGFDWQKLELTYQCQDAVGMFLQGPRLIIRILPKQMAC